MMKNIAGSPVEGHNFFGREDEIAYVWSLIEDGNNIILPSPRRVGKTSFAFKILEEVKKENWQVISMNLEEFTTEIEFVEAFVKELIKLSTVGRFKSRTQNLLKAITQVKPEIEYEGVKLSIGWENQKIDVYQELKDILDHSQPLLIFLDELTVLLNSIVEKEEEKEKGVNNVKAFLHWLRSVRTESKSRIKWIYCSSVGIANFTYTHKISDALNETLDYHLKSFDEATSKKMLNKLAIHYQLEFTEEIGEAIVSKLDYCLPYFLQLMFNQIKTLHRTQNRDLGNDIVEEAYEDLIGGKHFNTWIERIEKQYEDSVSYAFVLLKHICQNKNGSTRNNLQGVLASNLKDTDELEMITSNSIYMLSNDGYLIEEDGRYRFRSPLLRDFWFKRFVK
ncbi:MAG: ATP-binding protein [Cytophagales bacterium]|nr:ATP-binding protein [Cytophagales bacterium]